MFKAKEILDFIIETRTDLQEKLNQGNLTENQKTLYIHQIDAFCNLENWISWRIKTSDERQIVRIQKLATMRKVDALPEFIKNQEIIIYLYELFKEVLNYIKAASSPVLDGLAHFCELQLKMIDFKPKDFVVNFPSNEEIEKAFKPYFEITKPAKGSGNMFKECYEKIEFLYDELIGLNSTT